MEKISKISLFNQVVSPEDKALKQQIETIHTESGFFSEIEEYQKANPRFTNSTIGLLLLGLIVVLLLPALTLVGVVTYGDPAEPPLWVFKPVFGAMAVLLCAILTFFIYKRRQLSRLKGTQIKSQKSFDQIAYDFISTTLPKVVDSDLVTVTGDENANKVRQLLVDSKLIKQYANSYSVFNTYTIHTRNPVSISEICATVEADSNSFLFVVLQLPRYLAGETFIRTEIRWEEKNVVDVLPKKDDFIETIFEWNEFEDKFHISTTNEAEARYVLNPSFMESLHTWWSQAGKINFSSYKLVGPESARIKIVFKEDKMMMLLPAYRAEIVMSLVQYWGKKPQEYLFSVARAINFILRLTKAVNL